MTERNEPFKRWLNKHYPQDAHCFDTYKTLHREWMPYKRLWGQIAALVAGILLVFAILICYEETSDPTLWYDFMNFCGLFVMAIVGIGTLVIFDNYWEKKSLKPTPERQRTKTKWMCLFKYTILSLLLGTILWLALMLLHFIEVILANI